MLSSWGLWRVWDPVHDQPHIGAQHWGMRWWGLCCPSKCSGFRVAVAEWYQVCVLWMEALRQKMGVDGKGLLGYQEGNVPSKVKSWREFVGSRMWMLSVFMGIFFEVGWQESRVLYSMTSPASSLDHCIMHYILCLLYETNGWISWIILSATWVKQVSYMYNVSYAMCHYQCSKTMVAT